MDAAQTLRDSFKERQRDVVDSLPIERFAPLVPMNASGFRVKRDDKPRRTSSSNRPILIVCVDAAGGLGCMEYFFRSMECPCFCYDPLEERENWHASTLEEMAMKAFETIVTELPQYLGNLVIAGIGYGAVLAHAISTQIQIERSIHASVVLMEGAGVLYGDGASVDWIDTERRNLLLRLSTQLFDISSANGRRAVNKEAIMIRLAQLQSTTEQMAELSRLCPRQWDQRAWSAQVEAALIRFAVISGLVDAYRPLSSRKDDGCSTIDDRDSLFGGQVAAFLQRDRGRSCRMCISNGGPDEVWKETLLVCQPIALFLLPWSMQKDWPPHDVKRVENMLRFIVRLQEKAFRERAHRLVAVLEGQEGQAEPKDKDLAGDFEAGIDVFVNGQSDEQVLDDSKASNGDRHTHISAEKIPSYCLVQALNTIAQVYLRDKSSIESVRKSTLSAKNPTAWIFHTETGQITQGQILLGRLLDLPCFGVSLGPDAMNSSSSMEDLARAYCEAILTLHRDGPYLLIGTGSPVSAALAHSTALRMQDLGRQCGLIISDCYLGSVKEQLPDNLQPRKDILLVPDIITYAIFYFLVDFGMVTGPIGGLEHLLRETFTAWEQLLLIDQYRPRTANGEEVGAEWDEALYSTLLRANWLKLLLQKQRRCTETGIVVEKRMEATDNSMLFCGESAILLPRGVEGMLMMASTKNGYICTGERKVWQCELPCEHGDSLTTLDGRRAARDAINRACRRILKRLP